MRAGGLLLILIFVAFLVEKWLFQCHYTKYSLRRVTDGLMWLCIHSSGCMVTFFFWIRGTPSSESALCGSRWATKTPAVPGSYKRCTPWLELETCCADLKPFAITPRPLRTLYGNSYCTWIQNAMYIHIRVTIQCVCLYIYIYIVKWGNFQNIFLFNFSIKINIWKNIMI